MIRLGFITPQPNEGATNMLVKFDPELAGTSVDLTKTFDDRFVKNAVVGARSR